MKITIESALQATLILSTVLMTGCITEDEGRATRRTWVLPSQR